MNKKVSIIVPIRIGIVAVVCFTALGCERDAAVDPSKGSANSVGVSGSASVEAAFVDVTKEAGILHRHHKPQLDAKLAHINAWVSSVGAAAATGDFDNDGWLDLYVTDSRKGLPNYLYRNNGDGTFTDVAKKAGVADLNGDRGTSMDCVWADYNNDGWIDLYVVRWGEDALFRNRGDGTFEDVTALLFHRRDGSPGMQWANGNAVIFFDFNLDGRLDFYVGNYFDEFDLWHLPHTRIMHDDFEKARNGGRNYLFEQQADGRFVEVAATLGLDDSGWTLAVGAADINNDGYPDLYCADDFGPDQLFLNNRDGTFDNVTEDAIGFDTKKGMNVDFGDVNHDGWLDIYITNITTAEYLQEGNMLWHNNGPDEAGRVSFTDISLETGTYDGGWGWGAKFFDYDNDGDLDIIALNGFISAGEGNFWYDLASWTVTGADSGDAANWPPIGTRSFSGYETTRLWRNEGLFTFAERAAELGLYNDRDGRGVVVFDYDNDGDQDLFIANQDQPPNLMKNVRGTEKNWLTIKLETDPATKVNRDGIGTRVTVVTSSGSQIRERDGGNSYAAQSDPRLHFGLGDETTITLCEIRWPDGGLQYLENITANQFITVKQDPTRYATRLALEVGPPKPWVRGEESQRLKPPPIDPEKLERMLSEMEGVLRGNPAEYGRASTYRQTCTTHDRHQRAIDFFRKMVEANPDNERLRIEYSCALVDKIPTCGGLAAIVSKGTLAKSSLNQLDRVIADHKDLWLAYYCRGMNHLHWPRALRHSDDAAIDFEKCIELQSQMGQSGSNDYFVRTYIALGDSFAKAKMYAKARAAWRDGLALFPNSSALKDRLAISDNAALLDYVLSIRNLEQPIDTSLAFLDRKP